MTVIIGYCHPADIKSRFHHSLLNMLAWDSTSPVDMDGNPRSQGQILLPCITDEASWSRVPDARNKIVRQFLSSDADHLFMVDADMGFAVDTVDRLAAQCTEDTPVIGGLCFVKRPVSVSNTGAYHLQLNPTLYHFNEDPAGFLPFTEIPDGPVEVAGTGAACLMLHRSILEKVEEQYGTWFEPVTHPVSGERFSEDFSFCVRVAGVDKPIIVDPRVETAHLDKGVDLDRWLFDNMPQPQQERWAVIPAKDKLDLTRTLVEELAAQRQCAGIVVVDNGSTEPETLEWIETQTDAWVLNGDGMGIHEMWNLGIDFIVDRSEIVDIAFLNNDIEIGPDFVELMAEAIRSTDDVMVSSANYDGRDGDRFQQVDEICAGRYDGTGGMAGFAFMVRGELLKRGYRFPTDAKWWYGDNDLLMSVLAIGKKVVVARDAHCKHLDGGSQTGDWEDPAMKDQLAADRKAFLAKWAQG